MMLAMPTILRTAIAQPAPTLAPLRGGEILRVPTLPAVLHRTMMRAGVRPHGQQGVVLKADPVVSTPRGPRFIVHNYGHSGAGITLSWGCADEVVSIINGQILPQLRGTSTRPAIAVVGSGIIGLTVASRLRDKYPNMPIRGYARVTDVSRTTSFLAGGQYEPSLLWRLYDTPTEELVMRAWLLGTRRWIESLRRRNATAAYGVAQRRNYTLSGPRNGLDYANSLGALDCPNPVEAACHSATTAVRPGHNAGLLPFDALRGVPGQEYFTWLINPRILLPRLKTDLEARSVRFRTRDFVDVEQVLALDEPIIVNCTGYGARRLFGDMTLVPRRGHLVILPNERPQDIRYFFSGGAGTRESLNYSANFYMFARQSDIVLGGTVSSTAQHDEREGIDPDDLPRERAICEQILENARHLFVRGTPGACRDPSLAATT